MATSTSKPPTTTSVAVRLNAVIEHIQSFGKEQGDQSNQMSSVVAQLDPVLDDKQYATLCHWVEQYCDGMATGPSLAALSAITVTTAKCIERIAKEKAEAEAATTEATTPG